MRKLGLRGVRRGPSLRATISDGQGRVPAGPGQPTVPSRVTQSAVDVRLHVRVDLSERLGKAGIEPSVGSKGDSYDNALAETIDRLYKAELIHRRAPWMTKEVVGLATLAWVSWLNNQRLLDPIGHISPAEAETNFHRQLASQATTVAA